MYTDKVRMSYKIVDNFLDKDYFKSIVDLYTGNNFAWFYQSKINDYDKNFYFTQNLYINDNHASSNFSSIINIISKLNVKSLIRVKANMYVRGTKLIKHAAHVDYPFTHKGAIYYINTNNGKTILEDGTKIDSVANRLLFFDPSKKHSSTNCTDQKVRININFNYF